VSSNDLLMNLNRHSDYHECLIGIQITLNALLMFINGVERSTNDEALDVIHKMQTIHMQVHNRMFVAKTRIKDVLRDAISKMVHNHAEAVPMKKPIKLNIIMMEKAKCILIGSKDKETISILIDNNDFLSLIKKLKLQPMHQ
jgi:hypothetical protein